MERRTLVARDGIPLVYNVAINASSPLLPIVCICGLSSVKEDWTSIIDATRSKRSLAVLDNRGIGESYEATRGQTITMKLQATDVIDMMNALGWVRAIVWGHSMGGMIAQTLTLLHPSRVAALVLLGTGASMKNQIKPPKVSLIDSQVKSRAEQERFAWDVNVTEEFSKRYPEQITRLVETLGKHRRPLRGVMAQLQSITQFDATNQISAITCPTLVIHGK
jgi:3-oxoadipate enol-lactonase